MFNRGVRGVHHLMFRCSVIFRSAVDVRVIGIFAQVYHLTHRADSGADVDVVVLRLTAGDAPRAIARRLQTTAQQCVRTRTHGVGSGCNKCQQTLRPGVDQRQSPVQSPGQPASGDTTTEKISSIMRICGT